MHIHVMHMYTYMHIYTSVLHPPSKKPCSEAGVSQRLCAAWTSAKERLLARLVQLNGLTVLLFVDAPDVVCMMRKVWGRFDLNGSVSS